MIEFKPGDLIVHKKKVERLDVLLVVKKYVVHKTSIENPEEELEVVYRCMPPSHYRKFSGNSYDLREDEFVKYRLANKTEYLLYGDDIE